MHKSIATIQSPEFINLTPLDINPLMSSCEIKVLYLGENRNHTYISREVATDMAKTLRGAPIVGYYREDVDDFRDHGNQVVIDDEGIKFNCLTKPYGFVSPDAKVWFQEFEDTDDFGNVLTREYLMTTGYLWTGQFEECKSAVEGEGKPHSMEIDANSMNGHWETNAKTGMDFFIINDATFSKLCILGDDIEPCFEGSKISAPEVSTSFTKVDDNFKKTLFTMMQDLQFALKGGQTMEDNVTPVVEPVVEDATVVVDEPTVESVPSEEPAAQSTIDEEVSPVAEESSESIEPLNNEDIDCTAQTAKSEEAVVIPEADETVEKYALLESENTELKAKLTELETKFSDLNAEYEKLVAFKKNIEDAEKDAMIAKFAMLSEEDKADVIQNKSKYTIEDIESKLSVICVRKKVNFDLSNNSKINNNMDGKIFTYNMNEDKENVPAWIQAVRNNKN